jgi:hypothetical protein
MGIFSVNRNYDNDDEKLFIYLFFPLWFACQYDCISRRAVRKHIRLIPSSLTLTVGSRANGSFE